MRKKRAMNGHQPRDPYDALRPGSAITHGLGIPFAIIGTIFLVIFAVQMGWQTKATVSFVIYGASMLALYVASTLYHSVCTSRNGRIALRKLDHLMIYFLIAGTYTPLCVVSLPGPLGTALLSAIWTLAVVGGVIGLFWLQMPRWLSAGIYLFMGWLAVIAFYPLSKVLGVGLFWLLFGGVLYTIGGVLYAVKWPGRDNPRFGCHEIFHVFILLGSVCHYVMMFFITG